MSVIQPLDVFTSSDFVQRVHGARSPGLVKGRIGPVDRSCGSTVTIRWQGTTYLNVAHPLDGGTCASGLLDGPVFADLSP